MKVKLYRNEPMVDISVFCSWSKERQDTWIKAAEIRNRQTFYISGHLGEIGQAFIALAVIATLVAWMFTGLFFGFEIPFPVHFP